MEKVIKLADKLVHEDGGARTAPKALRVLEDNVEELKGISEKNQEADFTFSYEEEADPEVFFVPYIWEVIVCVAIVTENFRQESGCCLAK